MTGAPDPTPPAMPLGGRADAGLDWWHDWLTDWYLHRLPPHAARPARPRARREIVAAAKVTLASTAAWFTETTDPGGTSDDVARDDETGADVASGDGTVGGFPATPEAADRLLTTQGCADLGAALDAAGDRLDHALRGGALNLGDMLGDVPPPATDQVAATMTRSHLVPALLMPSFGLRLGTFERVLTEVTRQDTRWGLGPRIPWHDDPRYRFLGEHVTTSFALRTIIPILAVAASIPDAETELAVLAVRAGLSPTEAATGWTQATSHPDPDQRAANVAAWRAQLDALTALQDPQA